MDVLQVLPQRGDDAEDVSAECAGRPAAVARLVVAQRAGGLVDDATDVTPVATCRRWPPVNLYVFPPLHHG